MSHEEALKAAQERVEEMIACAASIVQASEDIRRNHKWRGEDKHYRRTILQTATLLSDHYVLARMGVKE